MILDAAYPLRHEQRVLSVPHLGRLTRWLSRLALWEAHGKNGGGAGIGPLRGILVDASTACSIRSAPRAATNDLRSPAMIGPGPPIG
jgi:hypothetical protein